MDYELKQVILDDKPVYKLKCPKCNVWGYLDDDQFNGRVSILCEWGFHKTINFSKIVEEKGE